MPSPTNGSALYIALFCLAILSSLTNAQEFKLDASSVLNSHSDLVGIWVNSSADHDNDTYLRSLKALRMRSLRYGWQFGIFDSQEVNSLIQSPRDPRTQGYLANEVGRMRENFGPLGVSKLLQSTNAVGFAVLNTDGINYIGNEDKQVSAMSDAERLRYYLNAAQNWASWAKETRFQFFEIGNENDMSGGNEQLGAVAPWTGKSYAKIARLYLDAIKKVHPNAKCGINGGLLDESKSREWFRDIFETDPKLATDLDFVVAHKYEFWLDYKTWAQHADWDYGRLGVDYRQNHRDYFQSLPVQVTELGSWKPGENTPHYRSVLATEMLGNVRMDGYVEHVQFWPTRWGNEGGVIEGESGRLTGMGLGLGMYTRFALPIMFHNSSSGSVRLFAARGRDAVAIWIINHEHRLQECAIQIENAPEELQLKNEARVWRLQSRSNDPHANDTEVLEERNAKVLWSQLLERSKIQLPPTSVTVIQLTR